MMHLPASGHVGTRVPRVIGRSAGQLEAATPTGVGAPIVGIPEP